MFMKDRKLAFRRPHGVLAWAAAASLVTLVGCRAGDGGAGTSGGAGDRLRVVATTNLVADAVQIVGGDLVQVTSLMGPGVDPHLYKAKEGDVSRMSRADAIFYGGLHLEGKMVELFEQMDERGRATIAVTDGLARERLIESEGFGGNYDPHVWFDVSMWADVVAYIGQRLGELDPENTAVYSDRVTAYRDELDSLHAWVVEETRRVPAERRVLITSHDAFGYFGRAYEMEVRGLQGISTVSEAGTADVQQLAELVATRRIPALFIESSVSPRGIEAVREAVRARGFSVAIGGELFSDALGDANSPEGTYVGMVRHNVSSIVGALNGGAVAGQVPFGEGSGALNGGSGS